MHTPMGRWPMAWSHIACCMWPMATADEIPHKDEATTAGVRSLPSPPPPPLPPHQGLGPGRKFLGGTTRRCMHACCVLHVSCCMLADRAERFFEGRLVGEIVRLARDLAVQEECSLWRMPNTLHVACCMLHVACCMLRENASHTAHATHGIQEYRTCERYSTATYSNNVRECRTYTICGTYNTCNTQHYREKAHPSYIQTTEASKPRQQRSRAPARAAAGRP